MADKFDCVACRKQVTSTKNGRYRSHTNGDGEPCEMSSVEIPEHVLAQPVTKDDQPDVPREGVDFAVCPNCDRKVKLTRLGYFEDHNTTLRGGERCLMGGVRAKWARRTEDVPLPGDDVPGPAATYPKVTAQQEVESSTSAPKGKGATEPSPESTSTFEGSSSTPNVTRSGAVTVPAGSASAGVLQPFSPVLQPFPTPDKVKLSDALDDAGKERVARFKETFFAYSNRRSSDNRSAQVTLGPSEIGYPCDRRLAMKLMNIPPVNPGGDGWASWKGTQGHRGMDDIYTWASANSGRFATELRLEFDSVYVPRGTTDLLDRQINEVVDFKFMGRYSLNKLIEDGPPEHYEVQLDVYGLGVERMGEKVSTVALYAMPAEEPSLERMYAWVKPYDRSNAVRALNRVTEIAERAKRLGQRMHPDGQWSAARPMEVAAEFEVDTSNCRYCPFYLRTDNEMRRGCPGK